MGSTRGRKALPDAVREAVGLPVEPKYGAAPRPSDREPVKPVFQSTWASQLWDIAAQELKAMGQFHQADAAVLEAYCRTYGYAMDADAAISERGLTTVNDKGVEMKSPYVVIANESWGKLKGYAIELGLTPVARMRLRPPKSDPVADALTEFLNEA